MKLINLHKQWMETGKLPMDGLCCSLPEKYEECLESFDRTDEDREEARKYNLDPTFWASGLPRRSDYRELAYAYTPLRQTIVLLICAMEGEL